MRSTRSARTQVLSSFCSSITHGSAGGGTASPECPAGLQGPGGAAAPRGHLPRPEAPPRRSPGLHPAGPAGVDEGHSEPAGPKAAARAEGLLSDPPEASDTSRATQSRRQKWAGQQILSFQRELAPQHRNMLENGCEILSKGTEAQARQHKATCADGWPGPERRGSPRPSSLCLIPSCQAAGAAAWRRGVRRWSRMPAFAGHRASPSSEGRSAVSTQTLWVWRLPGAKVLTARDKISLLVQKPLSRE